MTRLKIAIQKSGRLLDDSLALLKECDISINNGKEQLMARASNFPLETLYLRNSDIPHYVEDGVVDLAIIGKNTVIEKQVNLVELLDLGFSACRVSIAAPRSVEFTGVEWLRGKRVATSYPNTLRAFLSREGIDAEIHVISGSVEIAPGIGLSDAICDVVSSGSTLVKNGLEEVLPLFSSTALLVARPGLPVEKQELVGRLVDRVKSVLAARDNKYILLNAPGDKLDEICRLLPGMRSPTVTPLRQEGWYSLHSVVNEKHFWESIDRLKAAGAEGILVIPIEKMIM
ncbi:MAG: ATP phosphoribosyltransferase [Odoribacteraceae bacterium]|jgi:ATP phosphoribosyltransferase|nr:ATP phosphoribosyltransferase [Odoribacteraceae bacterium]